MKKKLWRLLTTEDLARILRKSIHSIRHDIQRNPDALPPRCHIPSARRNLWREEDVRAWLENYIQNHSTEPQSKKVQK